MEDSQVLDERNDALEAIMARLERNADDIQRRAEALFQPPTIKETKMPDTKVVTPPKLQIESLTPANLLRQRPDGTWEANPEACKAASIAIKEALTPAPLPQE